MKTILNMTCLSLSLFASAAMADVFAVSVQKVTSTGIETVAQCLTKADSTNEDEISGVGQLSIQVNNRVAIRAYQFNNSGFLFLSIGKDSKEAVEMEFGPGHPGIWNLRVANGVNVNMQRIEDPASVTGLKFCQR